jgi:hypothetical protein
MLRTANDIMFRSLTEDRVEMLKEMINDLDTDGVTALHELEAPQWRGKRAPSA